MPETARGPSGFPAPIQEQANRGFELPVFLRGFLAAAHQSQAPWHTGDKKDLGILPDSLKPHPALVSRFR
jgi:hypothetical protein